MAVCPRRFNVCARPQRDSRDGDNLYRSPRHRRNTKRTAVASLLPSRAASRLWGLCHSVPVPPVLREPLYRTWGWALGCKLEEAERPLREYNSFQDLFSRSVKPGTHTIDADENLLVSPVDGRAVSVCEMDPSHGVLEQVKGVNYSVQEFLGMQPVPRPGNKIFAAVMYLAPGDYHRYHSPVEWSVHSRTHFAGLLLPVNRLAVNMLPSLFCHNERVCCYGEWKHGFFSYTAVGATNVGSMTLDFDDSLRTNSWGSRSGFVDAKAYERPVHLERGQQMGRFRLGSTVVLVFEAPASFEFATRAGDRVRMGRPLGHVVSHPTEPVEAVRMATAKLASVLCDFSIDSVSTTDDDDDDDQEQEDEGELDRDEDDDCSSDCDAVLLDPPTRPDHSVHAQEFYVRRSVHDEVVTRDRIGGRRGTSTTRRVRAVDVAVTA